MLKSKFKIKIESSLCWYADKIKMQYGLSVTSQNHNSNKFSNFSNFTLISPPPPKKTLISPQILKNTKRWNYVLKKQIFLGKYLMQ